MGTQMMFRGVFVTILNCKLEECLPAESKKKKEILRKEPYIRHVLQALYCACDFHSSHCWLQLLNYLQIYEKSNSCSWRWISNSLDSDNKLPSIKAAVTFWKYQTLGVRHLKYLLFANTTFDILFLAGCFESKSVY